MTGGGGAADTLLADLSHAGSRLLYVGSER